MTEPKPTWPTVEELEDIALSLVRGHHTRVTVAVRGVEHPDTAAGMLEDLLKQTLTPLTCGQQNVVLRHLLARVGAFAGIAIHLLERDLGISPQKLIDHWRDNAAPSEGDS